MTLLKKVINFYTEGFRTMPRYARSLWIIILLKLFIMFFVLKLFFFENKLKTQFETDQERSEYIIDELTK